MLIDLVILFTLVRLVYLKLFFSFLLFMYNIVIVFEIEIYFIHMFLYGGFRFFVLKKVIKVLYLSFYNTIGVLTFTKVNIDFGSPKNKSLQYLFKVIIIFKKNFN